MTFPDAAARDAYLAHPAHVAAEKLLAQIEAIAVCDHECAAQETHSLFDSDAQKS